MPFTGTSVEDETMGFIAARLENEATVTQRCTIQLDCVLPFWLAPEQIVVAPIAEDHAAYAAEVLAAFEQAGLRAVLYDASESLSCRIVAARQANVPVLAILGQREAQDRHVTLRERNGAQALLLLAIAAANLAGRS